MAQTSTSDNSTNIDYSPKSSGRLPRGLSPAKQSLRTATFATGKLTRKGIRMGTLVGLSIIVGIYLLVKASFRKHVVCKDCGYDGRLNTTPRGSLFLEVILWICFLIPGLIYSIWRSSTRSYQCPDCEGWHMIPADSRFGSDIVTMNRPLKKVSGGTQPDDVDILGRPFRKE